MSRPSCFWIFAAFAFLTVPAAAGAQPAAPFSATVEKDAATGWGIVVLRHQDADALRHLEARIAPEAGANMFSVKFGGQELLFQPAKLGDLAQQRTGMPIMFPMVNRVRDARMVFEGRTFTFEPNNQRNFIHGLARRRPWRAEPPRATATEASAALALDWDESQPEFARFPIKHRITVTYTLRRGALRIDYLVENRDGGRLPYAFGLHPYFRVPGARRDVSISAPLGERMEAVEMLPTGKLLPVTGTAHDLRRPRSLETLDLDDVYFGMTPARRAFFRFRDSGIEVGLRASRELTHLVVFTPWDRPVFAIENQTSSTDAHNLWNQGKKRESHLMIVEPNGKSSGFVSWDLTRRAPPPAATAPAQAQAQKAHAAHDQKGAARLVPLLSEVLRFPTVAGNDAARRAQQAWLQKTATALGLAVREGPLVTEVELEAPVGAPVLGLLVHGDVVPVEEKKWTIPPFEGVARDGQVLGRGAADDKGPLVQALLAMVALRDSGLPRTHTIRLIVGSDEESTNLDIAAYLKNHHPPEYSLVLDSMFPVVVGEKAWNTLALTTPLAEREGGATKTPYRVEALEAGLSPGIVPDEARLVVRWKEGAPAWEPLADRLRARPLPPGIRLEVQPAGETLTVITRGKSTHGGVNLEGGRNALVALARLVEGALPAGGAADLLAAARAAGQDLHGTGLGLTDRHPLWGRHAVNVATLKPVKAGHELTINIRRIPPLTGPQLRERLAKWTASFNARTGAHLQAGGFYADEPLSFDPGSKLVKRLLAAYARATGSAARPAISGGGTYAKRMPNSIAFGMWFPGAPYPGHDVDEKVSVLDLQRGTHVLIEALVDLACSPPLREPFSP